MLVVGASCAGAVRHLCLAPGPPVDRPVPGTPRAEHCEAYAGEDPWLLRIAAPAGAVLLAAAATRARKHALVWLLAVAISIALVAEALVIDSQSWAPTV
ncbi:hypothetical protein [Conexibacter sp. SYSU D00693]|uniref:hypothetical protein n=1 Tax=Conexibacter sp. SYSU D00693 TaxID=2812560 RepID=UPI00196A779C|nr:hypothetical protein [Conexibacter sp. SYSU D00693]